MTLPLLLLSLLAPSGTMDSLPVLKKCGPPVAPVGIVSLTGTVAFEVTANGGPKIDDLSILEVTGTSAAELRSVLQRDLPACKFKPGKHWATGRIRMTLAIENGVTRWGAIAPALSADSVDTVGIPLAATLGPADTLTFTDPRLEERPAAIQCSNRLVVRDEVVTKVRIDGRIANVPPPEVSIPPPSSLPHQSTGEEVLLRYAVSPDGRVHLADVTVVQAPSPEYADRARAKVSDCVWVPGRVGGVPVPVRIASRERF
jgi:hypothetical protein